jgi:hypothetical protein
MPAVHTVKLKHQTQQITVAKNIQVNGNLISDLVDTSETGI